MQEPEPRQRRAKYPGLAVLAILALVTMFVMIGWFLRRDGVRETVCEGIDCVTTDTGPVPEAAFMIAGVVLVLLVAAMATVVRAGRRQR